MKKIKLLYDVARTMKNMAKIDGVITVDVRKDQDTVMSLRNTFAKDETGKVKANVSTRMNMNGEDLTRESTTEFNMTAGHSPCMMWKSLHRHHGAAGCSGIRGALHRISIALGILSSLRVEEKPNGAATISLDLHDVPDELQALLRENMQRRHGGGAECCCMQGCSNVELLGGLVVITVNENHAIDKMTVNLNGRVHDAENAEHSLAATAEVQLAW